MGESKISTEVAVIQGSPACMICGWDVRTEEMKKQTQGYVHDRCKNGK